MIVSVSDHGRSGGDAEEGAGAGRGPEAAGHHPTAAVQVPPHGAAAGRPRAVRERVCECVWASVCVSPHSNVTVIQDLRRLHPPSDPVPQEGFCLCSIFRNTTILKLNESNKAPELLILFDLLRFPLFAAFHVLMLYMLCFRMKRRRQ